MLAFDFRRRSNQRLIHTVKLDRELFEKAKRIDRLGVTHAAFDNVKKFPPIDPPLRMHVLSKPIEGNFPPQALCFGAFENLRPHGCKLCAEANVVYETSNLLGALATFDPADSKVGERRQ